MTGSTTSRRTRTGPIRRTRTELEERVRELEERIAEMEQRRRRMEATQAWFRGLMPPEAGQHFKTAAREELLGLRSLVDHWIGRLDQATRSEPRETIPID